MMDILALTETSEKEDTGFLINVEIAGYEKFHTASRTAKGGTAIYVNKNYNTIERNDLNANKQTNFREDVSIQNWDYTHENVHDLFKDFYSKLEGAVNRHAPLKKLSPKEIKVKSKPWLNAEILKMIKIKNKVFNRKKRQPNNEICKHLYNLLRNRINRISKN